MISGFFGFLYKVFTMILMTAIDAHLTVFRNFLPRDVVKPKIIKGKTTKYFDEI